MYEYHKNVLSIPAKLLYEDWNLISYDNYQALCKRGKLVRTKEGKGYGNSPFISVHNLPFHKGIDFKQICIDKLGPPTNMVRNQLENYIIADSKAIQFFASHRKPDAKPLSEEKQREKATNCMILNAIQMVIKDKGATAKMFGRHKTKVWKNISDAVNAVNPDKWSYSLPGNERSLQRKYEKYVKEGYKTFIHANEGSTNAQKIKGEIADFILSQYCLPNKLTIPMVLSLYNQEKDYRNWDDLTESAIYNWLYQPEQERIWTLARHGKESWAKKFKHTLTRDKSNWYPNSFWAIDGTKLDWIHYDQDSSNGMAAKLKIDVMFDVYSEKIIGWNLSFTENHIDHFKVVKMAVNEAQCKPLYLTYDNQSGHKMPRMQELYSSIVAVDGGTHHANKAKEHNNPAEQLFNRFQQQVITKFWFSDGQGVKVRRDDNRMNEDFILANKHQLKTIEQLQQAWETAVNIWNNSKHPKFKETRSEVYQHEMAAKEPLTLWEIMDKMWINETKAITYKAHGLDMWLGTDKYQFEVLDSSGSIDLEFRRKNIRRKFIVRYDPDFLDGYVQLCMNDDSGNIVHVANASPKRKHQNIPALMKSGDKEAWLRDQEVKELEYKRDHDDYKKLMLRSGITPQSLIDDQEFQIKMKGSLPKEYRNRIEACESAASRL